MRAALREARTLPTSVGRVNLRMSVGLHSGSFHLFRVGDTHHELLISGPAATETTRMEQAADAGEIVVSPDTAARLPAGAVGAAKGAGRLLRWRRAPEEGPGPMPARAVPSAAVETSVPAGSPPPARAGQWRVGAPAGQCGLHQVPGGRRPAHLRRARPRRRRARHDRAHRPARAQIARRSPSSPRTSTPTEGRSSSRRACPRRSRMTRGGSCERHARWPRPPIPCPSASG